MEQLTKLFPESESPDRVSELEAYLVQVEAEKQDLIRQIAELKQQLDQSHLQVVELTKVAAEDPLTGIPNRREFDELVSDQRFQSYKNGERREPLSLIAIDLDGFKAINDTAGHGAGDEYLKAVAEHIKGVVRETDTVARVGGDEFVVVFEGAQSEAESLTNRISAAINQASEVARKKYQDVFITAEAGSVTASIGVATSDEKDFTTAKELLNLADERARLAKAVGKNAVITKQTAEDLNQ